MQHWQREPHVASLVAAFVGYEPPEETSDTPLPITSVEELQRMFPGGGIVTKPGWI